MKTTKILATFCILKFHAVHFAFDALKIHRSPHRFALTVLLPASTCVPVRPANLLLDRSSSEVPSVGTVGDWMDGMRTLPCKEAFSGVSYSSCDTLAKTSTE